MQNSRQYATMMSKNSDKAEFSMQNNEDEFPALGGSNTPGGPPPGNLLPGMPVSGLNGINSGINSNQPKSAVSEFQEQQALQNRQGSDVTDLLGKSLRKQGVKSDLVNGNNNSMVDPMGMRRMDSNQYYNNMGRPSPQNLDQRSQGMPPQQINRQSISSGNSNNNLGGPPPPHNIGALSSQSSVTSSQPATGTGLMPNNNNNNLSSQSSVLPPSNNDINNYSNVPPPNRGPPPPSNINGNDHREHLNSPGMYINQSSHQSIHSGIPNQSVGASHNMSPMPNNNNYTPTNLPEPDVYRHSHPDSHLYNKQGSLQGGGGQTAAPLNQLPLNNNGSNNINGPNTYSNSTNQPLPHVVSQHPINLGSPKNMGAIGRSMDEMVAKFQSDLKEGKLCLDPETYAWHNVPDGMLKSQFGMLSVMLSSWIPSKDRILTHGMDLDKLGIHDGGSHNLELHDPELPKCGASDLFAGPFANHPNRWVDIKIPSEFSQHMVTPTATGTQRGETVSLYHALKSSYGMLGGSDLLARVDPMKYDESLLFWIYYNYPEDVLMMACGWALKQKKWSYHKIHRFWFNDIPEEDYTPCENPNTGERGRRGKWTIYDETHNRFYSRNFEIYESDLCDFNMKPHYDYVVSDKYSEHHFMEEKLKQEKMKKSGANNHMMQPHMMQQTGNMQNMPRFPPAQAMQY